MEPIVLIHGYSSESAGTTQEEIDAIFGTLRQDLENLLSGQTVVTVNVSRYVSLDDMVDLDDVTAALDRQLRTQLPHLLDNRFNVIVHSTGALVMRNWIRRYDGRPCPVKRLIHLAGANFGSGWAHIGESQSIKWLRHMGQGGSQRGMAMLGALELGSNWTIDLHRHFLQADNDMLDNYDVMEFNIVGSQVPAQWVAVPIRYAKEDGSDGVVRVSASNLNFHYLHIGPTHSTHSIEWEQARAFAQEATSTSTTTFTGRSFAGDFYEIKEDCRPAGDGVTGNNLVTRSPIPLAIPYNCAHSSDDRGIVYGKETRQQLLPLIGQALSAKTRGEYSQCIVDFDAATEVTYQKVSAPRHSDSLLSEIENLRSSALNDPIGQYEQHAQIIFRVFDQYGRPVNDYSIYFNSASGDGNPDANINALFQDSHRHSQNLNTIVFYLRTHRHNPTTGEWESQIDKINGVGIEIDCVDVETQRILFVPMRWCLNHDELNQWVRPHRTTIIDVTLLRLPSADTFTLY